uniref:FAD-binding PCMH-type domain-containing protein n=1 Tax=Strigamia maritima TaxID=126957 RepID=T1JJD0_STRMM
MMATYCTAVDINGQKYSVPKNLPPNTCLGDFIRDHAHLKGTKLSCREGACGACVVSARLYDPVLKKENIVSVNSCLLPVYSCLGLQITTVEGLGDKRRGYHAIQERLAKYNGTQCGFCSPGFVTSMYSLLEKNPIPYTQDVEDLFDGNACRCTGYRSILDAMKSFATSDKTKVQIRTLPAGSNGCLKIPNDGVWYHPSNIQELYTIMKEKQDLKTRLVFGNTSTAIFKFDGPYDVYIDLKGVAEMFEYQIEDKLSFGANVSLAHLISILSNLKNHSAYRLIANHVQTIATTHVRNVGSWAGNLMIKYYHNDFPSDLFVIFECIGAALVIGDAPTGTTQSVHCEEFLKLDMQNKVLLKMVFPPIFSPTAKYNSFKVMPRAQSAHAYVSGAFLAEVDERDNCKVLTKPSIVFGGLSLKFIRAKKTEQYLVGQKLADVKVFQAAVNQLSQEIVTEDNLHMVSSVYRKQLALNLFYKYVLSVIPKHKINPRYWNASGFIERPMSSGKQTYDTIKSEWPLNQPISKIEAKSQCSGEAEYIPDIVRPPGTLYGAFVISTLGNAEIVNMDASDALKMPGVLAFLTHKDIPGKNICVPMARSFFYPESEELFCSGNVLYAGQSLGLIVAERDDLAKEASRRVKVDYKSLGPPVLTIKEALKHPARVKVENMYAINEGDVDKAMANAKNKISGEIEMGTQFHFHLETQVCLTIPTNEGFTVYPSTQFSDGTHAVVAQVLGVNRSSVHVEMRRLGGAYGGKISRNFHTSSACALASQVFNKPVYVQMDLNTNLEMLGSRKPFLAQYEVGFDDNGRLEAVKMIFTMDYGCHFNDPAIFLTVEFSKNAYTCPNWSVLPQVVRTNLPVNTYCRTPGSIKGVFVIETIMEHIAKVLNKVPIDMKCVNMPIETNNDLYSPGLRDIISQLKVSAEFEKRLKLIADFNKGSAWKKKGITIVPIKYDVGFYNAVFNVTVSIFNDGGSVQVAHGGIECGQGINTKVAQVCAYTLGVPLELVVVLPANTFINPNSSPTVASTTSEINCLAVSECCKILVKRIQPIRDAMENASWEEIISACIDKRIDLCARFVTGSPLNLPKKYVIYGATCAEAEVDGLTGEAQISRVDLLYDCGQSLSPEVDIGQIEGSFVMGMGMFLLEKAKFDFETGRNMSNSTWEYYLPTTKDIPVDFRVTMLKNSKNSTGVLKSKTAGEPPLCMSCSVLLAVQQAMHEFRKDNGEHSWVPMNSPSTRDKIALACNVRTEKLVF